MKLKAANVPIVGSMLLNLGELNLIRRMISDPSRKVEVGKCRVRLHAEPTGPVVEWDSHELPKSVMDHLVATGALKEAVDSQIKIIESRLSKMGVNVE